MSLSRPDHAQHGAQLTTPPRTSLPHASAPQAAADKVTGATRKIFIEFLERSCTAEFSGFLLYKELARRMKPSAPEVAEM